MRNSDKYVKKIVPVMCFVLLLAAGCFCSDDSGPGGKDNKISPRLFGANLDWKDLAGNTMEYGDLIQDRSFRCKKDLVNKVQVWGELSLGSGSINWNTVDDGDTNPPGGKSYMGYVELSQPADGYTGITQQLVSGVKSGCIYKVTFSSFGVGGDEIINVYLYDLGYNVVVSGTETAVNNIWTHHTVTLAPLVDVDPAILAIYLTTAGTIRIDEVRLFQTGSEPLVKSSLKDTIQDLGVTSLRWPGGTLADWFDWTASTGPRLKRGELQAYGRYETPALGLHEFLDLCEELDLAPLVQVNVFDTPASAADLVEYILGPETFAQGAIRKANGRSSPWVVSFFEIGNEPAESYAGGSLPDGGTRYASLAKAINTAMKGRAGALGKSIQTGGISEGAFQMSDWLVPGVSDLLDMLYYWNSQVFTAAAGISDDVDFTHAHFYASRKYFSDTETNYRHVMTGGELLRRTIDEKITNLTSLPVWITEYHAVLENNIDVIQTDYLKDFQSGLSIADMLMHMIDKELCGAYIYNLIDLNGFGIIRDAVTNTLRPAGLVFRLFSVMAGEELLDVNIDNNSSCTIGTGAGNVPSNFVYPLVSVIASRNSASGKPRVMLLNRDYNNQVSVTIDYEGFVRGDAARYCYENASLAANNETASNTVSISEDVITVEDPFIITIPAHSLMRIDFQ